VLVGLLSKGRVRRFESFRAQFEIPLCARHEAKRKLSNWILILISAAFFLSLFLAKLSLDKNPGPDPRLVIGALGAVAVAMLLGVIFSYKPFRVKKIDDQFIWLRVSPEYLAELREEPTEDPEASVWKRILIGLAFVAVIAGGVWFQWRSAKEEEHHAVAQAPPQEVKNPGGDGCQPGFVWRQARPEDHVCVTPETRQSVAEDNRQAESRRDPLQANRPGTCRSGFVWREAFAGDVVCVTPGVRRTTAIDNSKAGERRQGGA
jgi:hypothetical protein